jgi:hypothetical protein
MQNSNPLSGHFRQPSVFMKLPSGGRYWQSGSISIPANGEIGIMPMTTKDEIMLRTPDALMNGQGVVSVIESCVPAINNAWAMPSIDVDAVLIAIRMATYGEEMDMESKCPNCDTENRHQFGLGQILMRVRSPNYNESVNIDNLIIKLKPVNYLQSTQNNIARFEEQKIIQLINNDDIDGDTRKAQLDIHLQKIIASNIEQLTNSTESITTENGDVVDNKAFISEFYDKSSNNVIKTVQKKLRELADIAGLPPTRVMCEGCEKEYDLAINFDYANFFEPLS